ncbi:MAG: carbon-phosphorus lyase [Deltaproteobacteria bacterium]|nr:MAG: carbon-phosphorus lyase [Deltaproteobacteria bacterium]
MGYIAVRGGEQAITNAEILLHYYRISGSSAPLTTEQILEQLPLAVDRVMSEGALYAPELAAAALKQAAGDTLEASFLLRAHRSSVSRIGASEIINTERMRVVRRISAAFKDIPGGQVLGATPDYTHHLIRFELLTDEVKARRKLTQAFEALAQKGEPIPDTFPKVVSMLRAKGLLPQKNPKNTQPYDITLQPLEFPAPRSARLQVLARAETGGILALAYANMRGYGYVHPVVGELRVGEVPLYFKSSAEKKDVLLGWLRVTECEVITRMEKSKTDSRPQFTLGYGLCFGHNEIKAISMAVLDRALMSEEPKSPTEDQEFVLLHTDGIEASGFCLHYKLPHYVTFQSDLERIRKVRTVLEKEKVDD